VVYRIINRFPHRIIKEFRCQKGLGQITMIRKFSVQGTAETAEQKSEPPSVTKITRAWKNSTDTKNHSVWSEIASGDCKTRRTLQQAARDFGKESARTMGIVAPRSYDSNVFY